jgi:hypothetical protein
MKMDTQAAGNFWTKILDQLSKKPMDFLLIHSIIS